MSEMYGPERLRGDLESLGYKATVMNGNDSQVYVIMLGFEVSSGRFAGCVIDLGVMGVANYPQGVAAAVHVRATPQLFEKTDTQAGVRNIQDSPLGPDWRYWSKNFNWESEKTTRRLISQINRIFEDA